MGLMREILSTGYALEADKWKFVHPVADIDFEKIAKDLKVLPLPEEYIELVKKYNDGYPEKKCFDIGGGKNIVVNKLISCDMNKRNNVVKVYNDVKDRLKRGTFPIFETWNGDLVCYNIKRRIVLWNHETDKETALADDLNKFMDGLYDGRLED